MQAQDQIKQRWFGIVTLFPEMMQMFTQQGVTGRSVKNGKVQVECFNPRDFTHDKHRTVDDRPYGGGPGSVQDAASRGIRIVAKRGPRVDYTAKQGSAIIAHAVRDASPGQTWADINSPHKDTYIEW